MNCFFKYVFFIVLLYACKAKPSAKHDDSLYKKNNIDIDVKYVLCHETDSTSRLYYTINNTELTYKKLLYDSAYTAALELYCMLKPTASSKTIIDAFTISIKDRQEQVKQGNIKGSQLLKIKNETNVSLILQLKDLHRKAFNESVIAVYKASKLSAQNFLLQEQDSSIVFDTYTTKKRTVLYKNSRVPLNYSFVSYATTINTLSLPPFSNVEKQTESIVFENTTKLQANYDSWFSLPLEKEGMYFIHSDSIAKIGCPIYLFGGGFPKVTTHQQMIESVRFITSSDEYEKLIAIKDKQKAIEDFWIGIGGNNERAKQLIKKYYARVQTANEKFSTYQEGWRTDRGMIYIIYGSPDILYQSDEHETWIYGQEGSPYSTLFLFDKVNHFLSNTIFVLRRDPLLKNSWYMAVDAWREGRIYTDD